MFLWTFYFISPPNFGTSCIVYFKWILKQFISQTESYLTQFLLKTCTSSFNRSRVTKIFLKLINRVLLKYLYNVIHIPWTKISRFNPKLSPKVITNSIIFFNKISGILWRINSNISLDCFGHHLQYFTWFYFINFVPLCIYFSCQYNWCSILLPQKMYILLNLLPFIIFKI